jgi:hypothetical protein
MVIFAYTIDYMELKTKIQAEQVQRVFGGLQALSGEDTNLAWIKTSPGASNYLP